MKIYENQSKYSFLTNFTSWKVVKLYYCYLKKVENLQKTSGIVLFLRNPVLSLNICDMANKAWHIIESLETMQI